MVGEGKQLKLGYQNVTVAGRSFDHALTLAQERNLERLCSRVIDHCGGLIPPNISPNVRAYHEGGKLQVELAFFAAHNTLLVRGLGHL